MGFKTRRIEANSFSTPQEMFQDNKLKTIRGLLDYQSQILDHYLTTISGANILNKNIALELPTGSGKTLVGILIAEFHRRKFCRKCLFVCPTKQLVFQVCAQAMQYGIEAIPFTGKQSEYPTEEKTNFIRGQAIGVTTYSSFFATNSFFENSDIVIFDDVHSSENYIIDNWSINISRYEHQTLYMQIVSLLENVIDEPCVYRMRCTDTNNTDIMEWSDLLPRTQLISVIDELAEVIRAGITNTDLKYAWARIEDNLENCQVYLSWNSILIRPYIPPTETHKSFNSVAQRIFMSATLGYSGELERITGCKKITRLPVVSDWDKKGLGRRLFIFPDLSLNAENHVEIISKLHQTSKRSVLIVPNEKKANEFSEILTKCIDDLKIYTANDLIKSKSDYSDAQNAMVIMANRFDGIDFPDDESRMLFIYNLPKITHLQEKFFTNRMSASLLYSERIKTRIVQAVGRCTRNAGDYSVVCILGGSILNEMTSARIQSTYHPELRAEISFGVENSTGLKNIDDILENICLFYERGQEWADAETAIVELRDHYVLKDEKNEQEKLYDKLLASAKIEVAFQYDIWKKDYQSAFEKVLQIIEILNAPSLSGYKCYWQYIGGCLAAEIGSKAKAIQLLNAANTNNLGSVKWLSKISNSLFQDIETPNDLSTNLFYDIVSSLEENIVKYMNNNKFEIYSKEILNGLLTMDGSKFEYAHLNLGKFLGYNAYNPEDPAAPDPYWIINEDLCIVFEDKIYEENSRKIPVRDVKQASQHAVWIKANVRELSEQAQIIIVIVTNATDIEEAAKTFATGIYYVNRDHLYEWSIQAINAFRTVRSRFCEAGDAEWRKYAKEIFEANQVTPECLVEFVTERQLGKL